MSQHTQLQDPRAAAPGLDLKNHDHKDHDHRDHDPENHGFKNHGFGQGDLRYGDFVLALLQESDCDPSDIEAVSYFHEVIESTRPPIGLIHDSAHSTPKRLLDVVGSLFGLSVLAVVVVPVGILIKLDSPGPVFFRQTRCGLDGRLFQMWKFRSMSADAAHRRGDVRKSPSPGYGDKSDSDKRITRVGRFLRATSLDELPQFLNVLRGEMSLVGTRPPTPFEVAKYSADQWKRLRVKTGMSGLWQVSGRSSVFDFDRVVELDVAYQQNWTIWRDLRILARTIPTVLRRTGAF